MTDITPYLDQPCPRHDCGAATLQLPKRNKNREYCYCETCRRKVQYVRRARKGGGHYYELKIVGATGDGLVSYTFRTTPARLAALKEKAAGIETVSALINSGIDQILTA